MTNDWRRFDSKSRGFTKEDRLRFEESPRHPPWFLLFLGLAAGCYWLSGKEGADGSILLPVAVFSALLALLLFLRWSFWPSRGLGSLPRVKFRFDFSGDRRKPRWSESIVSTEIGGPIVRESRRQIPFEDLSPEAQARLKGLLAEAQKTQGGESPKIITHTETRVYNALEEVPPDLREEVERLLLEDPPK